MLATQPAYANIQVSAARWSPAGNLVIFAGPDTSQDQLLSTAHIITSTILSQLTPVDAFSSHLTVRANIKWSKVLINAMPLQCPGSAPRVATSMVLHALLTDNNPSYKALRITQLPSWVKAPATYNIAGPKTKLSLIVAFEDPDSSLAWSLIKAKSLFVFGVQAMVKKWKYKAPYHQTHVSHMVNARLAVCVVVGKATLPPKPGAQAQAPLPPSVNLLAKVVATDMSFFLFPLPPPLG